MANLVFFISGAEPTGTKCIFVFLGFGGAEAAAAAGAGAGAAAEADADASCSSDLLTMMPSPRKQLHEQSLGWPIVTGV